MDRRKFISESVKYAAVTAIPFIIPGGRLFAATDNVRIKHVVYCMFAGGIRNLESFEFAEGNLMPNTLSGDAAISADIRPAIPEISAVNKQPLQRFGTLFKGFRYDSRITLHYHAHATAITGKYSSTVALMKPLEVPSLFEYFRKHSVLGQAGLKTWWISDQGGPFPYLQYSDDPAYGKNFAANMIQPSTLFKFPFQPSMDPSDKKHVDLMVRLLNQANPDKLSHVSLNTPEESDILRNMINRLHAGHFSEKISLWPELPEDEVNDDLINIYTACEILKTCKPHLTVVNMQDSDIGHSNFTAYCANLHKADYALAKLWQTIQEDDELRDQTVLIAAPEFGRNAHHNSIQDKYGRYAVDHTGDELSRRIFCLIAGPPDVICQDKVVETEYGEVIDIAPTIAHLLGFYKLIPWGRLNGKILYEALV